MTIAHVAVDAPRVAPALGGLLPVADVVEASDPHIAFGIEYQSFLCEDGGYTSGCVDAPDSIPVDDPKLFGGSHIVSGVPVVVYAGIECDLFGAPYLQQARDRLAGSEDRLVAAAFYRWAVLGQWNAGTAPVTFPTTITADNIVEAIASLEQLAGEVYAGQPVLHMNRYMATLAVAADVVSPGLDGTLTTGLGTPVAASAGYPDGVIFITGAVHLWRTPTRDYQAPNTATNTSVALAERTYVLSTDCLLGIAGGEDGEPPVSLDLFVPDPIGVTAGTPTTYTTRLTNTGAAIAEATETIRLHSADGPLAASDVTYETEDSGVWTQVTWTVVDGDLVFTETYPVPAGLAATSRVRITVNRDLADLTGMSTITGPGDEIIAIAAYDFIVAPDSTPAPTVTSIAPASGPVAGGTTVTITGTGFEG